MKIIALNCNHCGAPLDAPEKAKFITCSFCDSRLAIQRTGSSYSTELLEEIHETTQSLARDVAQIKTRTEVEELDRAWQIEKENYVVEGKHGHRSIPTKGGAIVAGVVGGGFGLFWTVMAAGMVGSGSSMGAPGFVAIFPLFGILFTAFAIYHGFSAYSKAESYERAQAKYRRNRQSMTREEQS